MTRDLTPMQARTLAFIADTIARNGRAPTVRDIAAHVGVRSTNAVAHILWSSLVQMDTRSVDAAWLDGSAWCRTCYAPARTGERYASRLTPGRVASIETKAGGGGLVAIAKDRGEARTGRIIAMPTNGRMPVDQWERIDPGQAEHAQGGRWIAHHPDPAARAEAEARLNRDRAQRVILTGQPNASDNGVWDIAPDGTWSRPCATVHKTSAGYVAGPGGVRAGEMVALAPLPVTHGSVFGPPDAEPVAGADREERETR